MLSEARAIYSPGFTMMKEIVSNTWDLLKRSAATKIVAESRVNFCHRWPRNLKDMLVRARVTKETETQVALTDSLVRKICKNKKCKFCPLLDISSGIKSSYTSREYMSKHNISCQSSNLIYCIMCKRCSKQYVGQTGDSIHKRFGAHSGSIGRRNLKKLWADISEHRTIRDWKTCP